MRTTRFIGPARLRVVAVVALAALLAACAPEEASTPEVAATVNGDDIPISELRTRYEAVQENPQFAEQVAEDEDGEFEAQVQAEILTGLIRARLLAQGADELGVEASDEDVDAKRAEVIEEVGGEEAFQQIIEDNNLSEETVQSQLRDLTLQDLVADELAADLEADPDDIQEAYDQQFGSASARHILVETEDEAEDVLARLDDGEDFGELAQEVSTDPTAEDNAGDLGEFTRGQMVPEFSEAVFAAEEGDILGPVATDFGFHVIEVLEIDEGPPLSEVEGDIAGQLLEGQRQQLVQDWLGGLAQEAEVTVNPRFGEWDPQTGTVTPADPLGEDEDDEADEDES